MPDTVHRLLTATLVIGKTGSGKTSLAATVAEYLWETYHRILVLASCDGGAIPTRVQTRVQQGLIRFWRMRTRSAKGLAFETCYLASKGYLPAQIDPTTGETSPGVRLIPPITTTYTLTCAKGHVIARTTIPKTKPHFCPICKTMYQPAEILVTEETRQTPGFEQVGGLFYDGLTSACGWFMEDMDERRGAGDISGGEGTALGKGTIIRSGDQAFGGNNKADFGFAQTRARQLVSNSLSIPNLVEGPIFTALTLEVAGDDNTNVRVVGGQLVGKALSDVMPQWFGNVYETAVESRTDGKKARRLYLAPYRDDQGRDHLLKNSSSGGLPDFLEDPPYPPLDRTKAFSQANLGLVFKLLDEDLQESLKDGVPNAPGLATAPTAYGVDETTESATAAPVPPTPPTPPTPTGSVPEGAAATPRPTVPVQQPTPTASGAQTAASASSTPAASAGASRRPIARPIARGRAPVVQTTTAGPQTETPVPQTTTAAPPQATPTPEPTTAPPIEQTTPNQTAASAAAPVQTAQPVQQPVRPPRVPPPPGMKPPMRAPGA